jgi:hypothetical protein
VELLEGPKEEKSGTDKRVRGSACSGEVAGWLQVSFKGKAFAALSTVVYKCIEAIAMTCQGL